MMLAPARQDRIVDAVVAPLTEHAQVRLVKQPFRCNVCLFDVMDDEAPFHLAASRAAVASLNDETPTQFVPRGFAQIGAEILNCTAPVVMCRTVDRGQVFSVAAMRTEAPRIRIWQEHGSARSTWALSTLDSLRPRQRSQPLCALRATRLSWLRRPVSDFCTTDDAWRDDGLVHSAPLLDLTGARATDLTTVRRVEWFGTDGAGFQHASFYHIQDDKALVQDSVMAAAIAAFQVVQPRRGWGAG